MQTYPRDDGDERANRQVETILPFLRGERGLDIGCGRYKTHPAAIGIDRNPFLRPDRVGNGAALPDSDSGADFVTAVHAVEFFWNTERALREWVRVLKPGGHLALILYDRRCLPPLKIGPPEFDQGFRHTFAPAEFLNLLQGLPELHLIRFHTLQDSHSFDVVCRKAGG